MKRATLILVIMLFVLSLSACDGFNNVMCNHLSDAANYHVCQATVQELIPKEDGRLMIKVIFDNDEDVCGFMGVTPNPNIVVQDYVISLELTAENAQILTINGFLDEIKSGDIIEVRVAKYIYSDTDFFYVAAVSCDGKAYLNFEDGLRNIIDMMNRNRSFF